MGALSPPFSRLERTTSHILVLSAVRRLQGPMALPNRSRHGKTNPYLCGTGTYDLRLACWTLPWLLCNTVKTWAATEDTGTTGSMETRWQRGLCRVPLPMEVIRFGRSDSICRIGILKIRQSFLQCIDAIIDCLQSVQQLVHRCSICIFRLTCNDRRFCCILFFKFRV